jgi:uncharacterized membrane protein YfcA
MEPLHLLLLLLAGLITGFLAGFFGIGGGILLVPVLLAYFQAIGVSSLVATHLTFGTSLFITFFTAISSAAEYTRNGHVHWKGVLWLGPASVAGAWIGSGIAGGLDGRLLQQIFAVVVMVAAVRMLTEQRLHKQKAGMRDSAPALLATGGVVGIVAPLAGVGGGVVSIPLMYSLLHFPLKKALGTSSATIVITALAASIGYVVRGYGNSLLPEYTLGYVAYLSAIPLVAGSIPMARVGARAAHHSNVTRLRRFFAVLLLVVAAKLLLF